MPKQPNILLFLTDDHGAWATGCYGNGEVQTPSLDALARRGARFRHAYTPTPVCSPARACLLTGKTASQVGIHDWLEEAVPAIGARDWLDGTRTLFDLLSAAGYYTGLSGKWHLGQSHLPPVWRGLSLWAAGLAGQAQPPLYLCPQRRHAGAGRQQIRAYHRPRHRVSGLRASRRALLPECRLYRHPFSLPAERARPRANRPLPELRLCAYPAVSAARLGEERRRRK